MKCIAVHHSMFDSASFRFYERERSGYGNPNDRYPFVADVQSLQSFQVMLQLPDNFPEPHEAPFWMKVGEAGEAFFVVETDEEVPEELQTSPVISATELSSPPSLPTFSPGSDDDGNEGKDELSATQQPFGKGQGDISIGKSPEALQAVSKSVIHVSESHN